MQFFDISLTIHNSMITWPGDIPASIKVEETVEEDGVRLSSIFLGSHTGTHVDAPNHFVKGATGVDQIALEKLIGSCKVIDLTTLQRKEILPEDFKIPISEGDRVLLKTGNFKFLQENEFPDEYVSLSLEAAEFLVSKKINLIGIDFLGIEKQGNPDHPVHTTLLKAGIVLVEGLELSQVEQGDYQLYCLPLKILGSDGSPARVILGR